MLALMETRVNIGINNHADETTRHGVLWTVVKNENGQEESIRVPLILDKPHLVVRGINYATWKRLKKQIHKMGIVVTHMELKGATHHYCYHMDKYAETLCQRKEGQPQYQLGYS